MAQITGSVRLGGFISPSDTTDTYPTHLSLYGRGGLKSVLSSSNLSQITSLRNETGSLVYVTQLNCYYGFINGS